MYAKNSFYVGIFCIDPEIIISLPLRWFYMEIRNSEESSLPIMNNHKYEYLVK